MHALLPMPSEVIERVEFLAQRSPAGGAIEFGRQNGELIANKIHDLDDLHDEDYMSDDDSAGDSDEDGDPPHPDAGVNGAYDDMPELINGDDPDTSDDESSDDDMAPLAA